MDPLVKISICLNDHLESLNQRVSVLVALQAELERSAWRKEQPEDALP